MTSDQAIVRATDFVETKLIGENIVVKDWRRWPGTEDVFSVLIAYEYTPSYDGEKGMRKESQLDWIAIS